MSIFNRKARTAAGSWSGPAPDFNGIPVVGGDGEARGLQDRMHDYVHSEGLARFSVSFVADAAARVDLVPELYVPGLKWCQDFEQPDAKEHAADAKKVAKIIDMLRGRYTSLEQTVSTIVMHKRTSGEVYLVNEDDPQLGVCFTPYGYKAVTKHKQGTADGYKIMDREGGTLRSGAHWVPAEQVSRLWNPHPDYPEMPYSSLWAGLKDLDRYSLLGKVIDRAANSALLNRGMIWFPGEAMDDMVAVGNTQMPRLARDYYASAKLTQNAKSDRDVSAIAPFAIWYDSDFGEPKVIKFGMPLEEAWFDMRSAVVADFARTVDLPSVMVINGGAGGSSGTDGSSSNHWSDLLVDRRTFDMTIGRDLDTVTHEDLTRHFLKGQLEANEIKGDWRVGYDPTKLIVNQDRTLFALDGWRAGVLSFKATGRRLGFRPDELATDEDHKKLAALITRSAQAEGSTRIRRRQDSTNMGGQGSDNVLPMTASAPDLFSMSGAQLRQLAVQADAAPDGIIWIDG